MRHKIAKRCRREILRRGATILKEGWVYGDSGLKDRKDRGFEVDLEYNGWKIYSLDDNELWAYKMALDCVKHDCDEPWTGPNQEETDGTDGE